MERMEAKQLPFTEQQKAAMAGNAEMTYDMFWECLGVCFYGDDMGKYLEICLQHPEHIAEFIRRDDQESDRSIEQAHWAKLKAWLIAEMGEDWVAEHCVD